MKVHDALKGGEKPQTFRRDIAREGAYKLYIRMIHREPERRISLASAVKVATELYQAEVARSAIPSTAPARHFLHNHISGISESVLQDMLQHQVPESVFMKLQHPHRKFKNEREQIECVMGCITYGSHVASRAYNKEMVVVVGNTGMALSF